MRLPIEQYLRNCAKLFSLAAFALFCLVGALEANAQTPTFYSPATVNGNDALRNSPAIAVWNGALWTAFQSNDRYNLIFISHSATGTNFPTAVRIPGISTDQTPALAVFRNQLFIAYHAAGTTGVDIISTSDGVGFTTPVHIAVNNTLPPSLAVYAGVLVLGYTGTDSGVYVTSSTDGAYWVPSNAQYTGLASSYSPGVAAGYCGGSACLLVAANGPNQQLSIVQNIGILGNYSGVTSYPGILMLNAPSVVNYTNAQGVNSFVLTFVSNDQYHLLFQTSGTSSYDFTSPAIGYSGIRLGNSPRLAFGALSASTYDLWVAGPTNDKYNLLVTSGAQ